MRRVMLLFGLIIVCSSLDSPSAAAAGPQLWQPAGPTHLDGQRDQCTLSRNFTADGQHILMQVRTGSALSTFEVILASETALDGTHTGEVTFSLEGQSISTSYDAQGGEVPDRDERFLRWFAHDLNIPKLVSKDQKFRLSDGRKFDIVLHWPGAKEAFRQFANCHDSLLTDWGVDPALVLSAQTLAKPANYPGYWVTNDDYPAKAKRARDEGEVLFLLTVDPDGTVAGCRIVRTSGHRSLDDETCALLSKRAKFESARDANGKAVTGYYMNRILWRLPR